MFISGQFKALYPNHPKTLPDNWNTLQDTLNDYVYDHDLRLSATDYLEYFVQGWEHQALLYSINQELNDDKKVKLQFTTHTLSKQDQDSAASDLQCFKNAHDAINHATDFVFDIHYIKHGVGIFGILDKMEHLQELKHISLLLQTNTKHRVRVYSNLLDNTITIITNNYQIEMIFKLLGLCHRLFDITIQNPHVLNMLETAGQQDYSNFLLSFNNYITSTNIIQNIHRQKLTNIFKHHTQKTLSDLERKLSETERNIEERERYLAEYYQQRHDLKKRLMAHTMLNEQDNIEDIINEFLDYIRRNKQITEIKTTNETIVLNFVSPVRYYDKDLLETIFERNPQTLHNDTVRQFLRETFLEEKYQLLMHTKVVTDIRNHSVKCKRTTDTTDNNGYIMHPHLMRHDCWGDNKALIRKDLINGDYIMALNQITAATMGINIGDSVVFRNVVGYIKHIIDQRKPLKVIDNETQKEINYLDKLNLEEEDNENN